jgi:M penetrans paralogue family 26
MENQPLQQQQALPNATAVLVLGICSIVVCGICGIIGLVMGNTALRLYKANPSAYTEASLSNVKAGRICSIIGICLMGIALICMFFWGSFLYHLNRDQY